MLPRKPRGSSTARVIQDLRLVRCRCGAPGVSEAKVVELVKPGELDRVPPGKWAAIKDGKVVAWAESLEKLRRIMEKKGYKREEYYVIKVPSHNLLVA